MPFIAQCPNCRSSKFRVPWKKHETIMACPGCHVEFELIPHDAPPDRSKLWASGKAVAPETLFNVAATVPDVAKPPVVESLPVIVPDEPAAPHSRAIDLPLVFALSALVAIGLVILAASFPYGRLIATTLCLVGSLLAGFSLFGLEQRRPIGWAALAGHGILLLLLLVAPGWLGASDWLPTPELPDTSTIVYSVGRDGGVPIPTDAVDASTSAWQQGDLRVSVIGARVAALDPKAKSAEDRKARGLFVVLQISNIGVARGLELSPKPEQLSAIRLTAASGKPTAWLRLDDKTPTTVFPGKSAERTLVFGRPAERSDVWQLELPAETFANRDPIRFRIPNTMIGR